MMAERGIDLARTTIMRWIQRYVPEFESRWNRFACKAGGSWRVDETYVKIKGCWTFLFRAVDSDGQNRRFPFACQAGCHSREGFLPAGVRQPAQLASRRYARWLSGFASSGREFLAHIYAAIGSRFDRRNTSIILIEQDHRLIKLRLGPMLGFKRFLNAPASNSCIRSGKASSR